MKQSTYLESHILKKKKGKCYILKKRVINIMLYARSRPRMYGEFIKLLNVLLCEIIKFFWGCISVHFLTHITSLYWRYTKKHWGQAWFCEPKGRWCHWKSHVMHFTGQFRDTRCSDKASEITRPSTTGTSALTLSWHKSLLTVFYFLHLFVSARWL